VPNKTHYTAVAIVPPEEVCGPIQDIRRRHDQQVYRWPPHINLLYPFRPAPELAAAANLLAEACATVAPFAVTLATFAFFRHPGGRCTLWLAPEPADALRALQAALLQRFPECDDVARHPAGFIPHLSVGQFATPAACQETRERLQAGWRPLVFRLDTLALLRRDADSPFAVECRVPVGYLRRAV
jgi:2'-5' RNA ligase